MKIFYKAIFVLTCLALSLDAKQETKVVKHIEAQGFGASKSDAISDALIQAVKKTKGVRIDSVRTTLNNFSSLSASDGKNEVDISTMSESITKALREKTNGTIDGYEVLDVFQADDGSGWESLVKVNIISYKAPGHSAKNRRSIAVVPTYTQNASYRILGSYKKDSELSHRLTQELVSAITKTRKFSVLDREANEAYANEKSLILSKDSEDKELLKLGNVLGADYLFVTTIPEFRIDKQTTTMQLTSQHETKIKAYATIQFRIIVMATRQIKWSSSSTFDFTPSGSTDEQIYQNSLKYISEKLTYELIENIYPIKIVDVGVNGNLILSTHAKVGTVYEVFTLGKKLYDSYTKEYLGRDEIQTGKIEVLKSLPKISYARVISGRARQGDICRMVKTNNIVPDITEKEKPSDIKQTESGGVILPF